MRLFIHPIYSYNTPITHLQILIISNERERYGEIMVVQTSHLPEILVHRFEEEFVAVDRAIVEDIFKIR